jgi:hypothetical protein
VSCFADLEGKVMQGIEEVDLSWTGRDAAKRQVKYH